MIQLLGDRCTQPSGVRERHGSNAGLVLDFGETLGDGLQRGLDCILAQGLHLALGSFDNTFQSIDILANGCQVFAARCLIARELPTQFAECGIGVVNLFSLRGALREQRLCVLCCAVLQRRHALHAGGNGVFGSGDPSFVGTPCLCLGPKRVVGLGCAKFQALLDAIVLRDDTPHTRQRGGASQVRLSISRSQLKRRTFPLVALPVIESPVGSILTKHSKNARFSLSCGVGSGAAGANVTIQLFMPGLLKPLSEWSPRALEQMRDDLLQQARVETSPVARDELVERYTILAAEAKRRQGELTPDEVSRLRASGCCEPFTARLSRGRVGEGRRSSRLRHWPKDRKLLACPHKNLNASVTAVSVRTNRGLLVEASR